MAGPKSDGRAHRDGGSEDRQAYQKTSQAEEDQEVTTTANLQQYLADHHFYTGAIDGAFGAKSAAALQACLAAGPDTPIDAASIAKAAAALGCDAKAVKAVWSVEAAGAGFAQGLPKILFEGHIFSALTGHKYDASHSGISYPHWDKTKYPQTQGGRYAQLMEAVSLNPDAAFEAASYGAFQILGENYKLCGFASPWEFVLSMCQSEGNQLMAFINFVKSRHLDAALRAKDWATFANGYNGSAYRQNQYDTKLAQAYARA